MTSERIGNARTGPGGQEALPARACVQSALMVDAKVAIEVIARQPRDRAG